jgi:hypothetical protein
MPGWTLLSIEGDDLPEGFLGDYAQRRIVMSLTMVDQAKRQRRTINGVLKDISRSEFHKHIAKVSCTDDESPLLYQLGIGKTLQIRCVPELGTHGEDTDGEPEQLALTVMVADWSVVRDENNVDTGWEAVFVEV